MPTSATNAANAVLAASEARGVQVDPMKLQKLIYLTHGYFSGLTGEPWVDEPFEAWDYGPVLPSIYRYFKTLGARPIKRGTRVETRRASYEPDLLVQKSLTFVLDKYGAKSAIYLSDLTHKAGSPWSLVKESPDGKRFKNADIPFSYITDYFSKLVTKADNA